MKHLRLALLASVVGFAWKVDADAADLPMKSAKPVEYVRVCGAYGAGFFYIPGTETCIRLSGRARFEYATQSSYSRSGGVGDYSAYRSLLRINVDARTQTDYGTLRAFLRLEASSRTGGALHSATANRIGNAFAATGVDGVGRLQNYIATDKAFVQFAGVTAGRASSFFDFYAHDFEMIGATAGSDMGSTNLLAYTTALGNGFSTTLSLEDPSFRRTPVYAAQGIVTTSSGGQAALAPIFGGYTAAGDPSGVGFVDAVQRNRMPDFVGTLRHDAAWGSAQLSGAVHEVNTGGFSPTNFAGTNLGTALNANNIQIVAAPRSVYGWAVQAGIKVNLPFIGAGDVFYLQAGYADGAQLYSGYSNFSGSHASTPIAVQGSAFNLTFNDAVLNPFTSKLETSTSFTAVASMLHYWSPEWRSALYGSYGELTYAQGSRMAQGAFSNLLGTGPGAVGTRYYQTSAVLRDSYQFIAGTSLIWSPIKDLDIGLEGLYTVFGPKSGRILDTSKYPLQSMTYVNNLSNPIWTRSSQDAIHVRARIQRDF